MRKNSVNKSDYSKGFLAMIRDNFDVAAATDICRLANEYSDDYINTHPKETDPVSHEVFIQGRRACI